MLARSSGYSGGNWNTNHFYHADGNGNITYLEDSSQGMAASYRYDPFGNTLSSSGPFAAANVYRFSSKEIHVNSGLYYYGYRFYAPAVQRWANRDPLGEAGGVNLYAFADNGPTDEVDPDGLQTTGILTPGIGEVLMDEAAIEAAKQAAARAAARAAIAAAAAAGTSFCKAPKDPCKGLRDQLNAHIQKLTDYIGNPEAHDNIGILKSPKVRGTPGLRDKVIDGRIRNLQKQIDNFRKQLEACEKANGM